MATGYVYRMVSKKNGAVYIGSSTSPMSRFEHHVSQIQRGTHRSVPITEHFAGHVACDIRFELLERVPDCAAGHTRNAALRAAEDRHMAANPDAINSNRSLKHSRLEVVDLTAA